jgi:hypothetical protein
MAELPAGLPDSAYPAQDLRDAVDRLRRRGLVDRRAGAWTCLPPIASWLRADAVVDEPLLARLTEAVAIGLAEEVDAFEPLVGTPGAAVALAWFARWLPALDEALRGPRQGPRRHHLLAAARIAMFAGLREQAAQWCDATFGAAGQTAAP